MTQIIASGGNLNIVDFQEDGSRRTGIKASLVKILTEETSDQHP